MKLIIQIPCYNEVTTLPITLAALPRQVPGFTQVEWLVVDDGSTDNTADVAQNHGVDHIVRHHCNKGLAHSFMTGINACLRLDADVIVNTDADNQYNAQDIPILLSAIVDGKADMVVGARPINNIEHFSKIKKNLQKLGSWVVRVVSRTDIPDAPSGFRAISRSAAKKLVLFSEYTYTLETIIQAKQKNISVISVPIRVNKDLRPSRLVKSIPSYIKQSVMTILRIFVVYRPFRFFGFIAAILSSVSFIIGLRFLYFYFSGTGNGHIQSLILAAVLGLMSFQACITAFLADIIGANRKLLEDIRCSLKIYS
ncbi:glycosyltransferase family 2 protein [Rickettsiella grylli]|uniref:Glycosyl transferase, group 2 family protein n=1 Tax=Rickettsiella grylli TaxID=59196 RepID=A8PPB5_9COXI|nr:glycosyltransferase family 2 protein [Rickettsiella grylli]EDP46312.1 glycosyl transferase, group 2 family protein [Rickettsiella grylli]